MSGDLEPTACTSNSRDLVPSDSCVQILTHSNKNKALVLDREMGYSLTFCHFKVLVLLVYFLDFVCMSRHSFSTHDVFLLFSGDYIMAINLLPRISYTDAQKP